VLGRSDDNDGVQGFYKHQDRSGVVGTNTGSGTGVTAQSATGLGIFSKGGRLAGLFEGNVDITGSLTVQGTNIGGLSGRIQSVEALTGRVQALENREQGLVNRVNTPSGPLSSFRPPLAICSIVHLSYTP